MLLSILEGSLDTISFGTDELESFSEFELPLWVNDGGLGLGGGVDLPKECFLAVDFSGLGLGGKEAG